MRSCQIGHGWSQDIQDPAIHQRIQYVPFEYLTQNPMEAVAEMFDWLGLKKFAIDPNA